MRSGGCPGPVVDEIPAAFEVEADPSQVSLVAPRCWNALLVHTLHLKSVSGGELDVVRRYGCRDDNF